MTPDEMHTPPEGGWESLKVDELKEELEARGLPKSGTKPELVARLIDDDVAQRDNVPAAETPPEEEVPDEGVAEEVIAPEEPAEEPSADEVEEAEEAAATPRRRGSAETSTGTRRAAP
jgi:SAP domain